MTRRWFARSAAIGRRDADRLLDGEPTAGHHDELATLLAAAAGPARPDELGGEREAVAGFTREFRREARTGAATARPRRPRRRVAAAAALSAVVLAAGGTAYAASTGRLPDAVERVVEGMFTGADPTSAPPSQPASPPGGGTTPTVGASVPVPGGDPGGGVPGADQARLTGLCRSWEATRGNPHANAISSEDLRVLATAAGGEERIEAFCAALLNHAPGPPAPSAASTPDRPGNPDPGNGRPTAPPGGGPTKGRKG